MDHSPLMAFVFDTLQVSDWPPCPFVRFVTLVTPLGPSSCLASNGCPCSFSSPVACSLWPLASNWPSSTAGIKHWVRCLPACMSNNHACLLVSSHSSLLPPGYKQSFAWLLTGSLGTTLITMNLSRVCHKLRPLSVCGKPTGRYAIISAEVRAISEAGAKVDALRSWFVCSCSLACLLARCHPTLLSSQIILSALVVPLATFISDSEKTKLSDLAPSNGPAGGNASVPGSPAPVGEVKADYGSYESDSEFKAMHLLVVLTVVVGILLLLESMVKAVDDDDDDMDEEIFFSKGTQTTLTSFAAQIEDSRANPYDRICLLAFLLHARFLISCLLA